MYTQSGYLQLLVYVIVGNHCIVDTVTDERGTVVKHRVSVSNLLLACSHCCQYYINYWKSC